MEATHNEIDEAETMIDNALCTLNPDIPTAIMTKFRDAQGDLQAWMSAQGIKGNYGG